MQWPQDLVPGVSQLTTPYPSPPSSPPALFMSPMAERLVPTEPPISRAMSTTVQSSPSPRYVPPFLERTLRRAKALSARQLYTATRTGTLSNLATDPLTPKIKERKKSSGGLKHGILPKQVSFFIYAKGNIEEIDPRILVPYYAGIKRIQKDYQPRVPDLAVGTKYAIWIHGTAGAGKTKAVADTYPEAYRKPLSKWWDGYRDQPVVVLDDIDPTHASWIGRFLKIWGDRYSFPAETKGGSVVIRPVKFIVTSQYTPEDVFADAPTREAIARRYVVIEKHPNQNILI